MSDTIVSIASVATERGARYGKQLVSHLGRKSVGVWDEVSGSGTLNMGDSAAHVTLKSTTDALVITVEPPTPTSPPIRTSSAGTWSASASATDSECIGCG